MSRSRMRGSQVSWGSAVQTACAERGRFRFQFGLRSLLFSVLAVSIGCSYLAVRIQRAKEQADIVAMVESLGGAVLYDYQFDGTLRSPELAEPPGPRFLFTLLGKDFFARVTAVGLIATDAGDDEVIRLAKLRRLQLVGLSYTGVTDAGLAHLECLPELRSVDLKGTAVTPEAIDRLQRKLPCSVLH